MILHFYVTAQKTKITEKEVVLCADSLTTVNALSALLKCKDTLFRDMFHFFLSCSGPLV